MALTRAQLLAGNSSQGTVLPGQVQGVTAGAGVTIDAAGVLSLSGNTPTFNGFVKTNNASAFNAFIWPNADGSAGQQLTTDGSGTLSWTSSGILWTQKGQILAATGPGSANQTLVNVGTDGQILIADSGTASGLNYTSNYVATGGSTSAAYMPAGNTLARPATPPAGSLRYNSTLTAMEFYNGTSWEIIAAESGSNFVEKTSDTGSAIMPAGNTAARDATPASGYTRFNTTTGSLEFYSSPNWIGVGGGIPDLGLNLNATNSLLKASTPYSTTPPTAGTATGQAINGSLYWDTEYGALFVRYTDGTPTSQWVMVNGNNIATGALDFPAGPAAGTTYAAPNGLTYTYNATKGVWTCPTGGVQIGLGLATNGGYIKVSLPIASTPPTTGTAQSQAMDGSIYWDNTLGQLFIRYNDGVTTQWVAAAPPSGSSLGAATLAQAAAGTLNTVYSSPQTSVPKDASGMTGAAILPAGTTAQRPATPVAGMTRLNTDTNPQLEQYAGGSWQPIGVISSNLTLNVATTGNDTTGLGTVAAPWATPHRAMEYLSQYAIKQGVTVTVSVAAGTYTFTTPLNLNHPNGRQIFINGTGTSGTRPTGAALNGNGVAGNTAGTEAFNDALLKAYYNTVWQFNGCNGLVCECGGNVTVDTVLIRGNATNGFAGVTAGSLGDGSSTAGSASSGGINLGTTVAVHNFGSRGIQATLGGSVYAVSVTVSNCNGIGIQTSFGGSINATNATVSNGGGAGIETNYGGLIRAASATVSYNSSDGIRTNFGGSINATSSTVTGNAATDILANKAGIIKVGGSTYGSISPAINTVGNLNAATSD